MKGIRRHKALFMSCHEFPDVFLGPVLQLIHHNTLNSCCVLVQFPDVFQEPVLQLIHHNTLRLEELAQGIVSHFRERFVPGEEVLGLRDGATLPCRIVSVAESDLPSGECSFCF